MAAAVCAALLTSALPAAAQTLDTFELTLDDRVLSLYNLTGRRTSNSGGLSNHFGLSGGPNHLYQTWWWYRGTGDSREYGLSNQVSGEMLAPNRVRLVYVEPVAGVPDALRFELLITLEGDTGNDGWTTVDWRIENLTGDPLEVHFFHYVDYDLDGSWEDDRGFLDLFGYEQALFRADRPGSTTEAYALADGAPIVRWAMLSHPDIRTNLSDSTIYDLPNSQNPYDVEDLTSAIQRRIGLGPGESHRGRDVLSVNILPPPAPVPRLRVTADSPVWAGMPADVTVSVVDANGDLVTDFTGTVRFSTSDPDATLPADYTFTAGDGGSRTFPGALVFETGGLHWLRAMDLADDAWPGIHTDVSVLVPDPPEVADLAQSDGAEAIAAGAVISATEPVLAARVTDPIGAEVGLDVEVRPVGTPFSGEPTASVAPDNASGTVLSVTYPSLADGGWRWQARGVRENGATGDWVAFGPGDPAVADFVVDTTPPSPVVEVPEAGQVRVAGASITLAWDTNDTNPDVVDLAYSVNGGSSWTTFAEDLPDTGTHAWTLPSVDTAAFRVRVTATDAAGHTASGSTGDLSIVPHRVRLVAAASSAEVGDGVDVTIRIEDASGDLIDTARAVSIAVDGSAEITATDLADAIWVGPANVTGTTGSGGTATLTVSSEAVGSVTVTGASANVSGPNVNATIDFEPGPAASLLVTGIASPKTAGEPADLTVEARDAFGNRATGYGGTVAFDSTDPAATLPGPRTFEAGDAGRVVLPASVVLRTAGTRTVTATDTGAPAVTGAHADVQVVAAAPVAAPITGVALAEVAEAVRLDLHLEDAFGNAVAEAETVTVTITEGTDATIDAVGLAGASAGGTDATGQTAAGGTGWVDVTSTAAETIRVCTSGPALTEQRCHDVAFQPDWPDHLTLSADPAPVTVGSATTITVQVRDRYGNPLPVAVEATLSVDGDARFVTGGADSLDLVTDGDGLASAAVDNTTAETVTVSVIAAAEVGGGALPAQTPHETAEVTFVPGPADHVSLSAPPSVAAGDEATIGVGVRDQYGNPTSGAVEVCVTVTSPSGSEPSLTAVDLDDVQSPEPSTVCGTTGAAGTGSVRLVATAAETITVEATSANLDGSGLRDGTALVEVLPSDPDTLRMGAGVMEPAACDEVEIDLRLVDRFDNPITDPAETYVAVTVTASATAGEARIVATSLVDPTGLPGSTVSGRLPAGGLATVTVLYEGAGEVTVGASGDLPGDIDPVVLSFVAGGPDPVETVFTSSDGSIFAGAGEATVTVRPRDGCGVDLGPDLDVAVTASFGTLVALVDLGDGRYETTFSTAPGECPAEPAVLEAVVEGVAVAGALAIASVCGDPDPDAPVWVDAGGDVVEACAAGDVWAFVHVVPRDEFGGDLGPDLSVRIDADPPWLVEGGVTATTDPGTGETRYTLAVGSDRCGPAAPRAVPIRVGGVLLSTAPQITFLCPEVVDGGIAVSVSPASVPADGETPIVATAHVVDACGNPAFGRPVEAWIEDDLPVILDPTETVTTDAVGAASDGTAVFSARSDRPGVARLGLRVGEGVHVADEAPLVFDLPDVLTVHLTARSPSVVAGQRAVLEAILENGSDWELDDLVLGFDADGLTVTRVTGAEATAEGGHRIAGMAPGEVRTIAIDATVQLSRPQASMRLRVAYGAVDVEGRAESRSERVVVTVAGGSAGCECATGAGAGAWIWAALLAIGLGLRARSRRAVEAAVLHRHGTRNPS